MTATLEATLSPALQDGGLTSTANQALGDGILVILPERGCQGEVRIGSGQSSRGELGSSLSGLPDAAHAAASAPASRCRTVPMMKLTITPSPSPGGRSLGVRCS